MATSNKPPSAELVAGFTPRVLLSSRDASYAAVFTCGKATVVLQSDDGRCIRGGPYRAASDDDACTLAVRDYEARGFIRANAQDEPLEGDEVREFMERAGFTTQLVQRSAKLCNR